MSFGLFKQGQGYWMRVITACMFGVLTLATAMWVASEAGKVADSLPVSSYRATLTNVRGTPPAPGERVELLGRRAQAGPVPVLGTAEVRAYDAANLAVEFVRTQMTVAGADPVGASAIRSLGDPPPFAADLADKPIGSPLIEPLYLRGGSAAAVVVLGALLTYFLVGVKRSTVDFLVATDMEMKKVNWSTRKDIVGSTWVVIGAAFLISALLYIFDYVLKTFFQLIGVLVR